MPIRFWVLLLLLLSACSQTPPTTPSPTSEPATATLPLATVLPPTLTASPEPTATPQPTDTPTPQPTDPPSPTATQVPTDTPTPAAELTLALLRNGRYPTTFVDSGIVQLEDGEFQQIVSADSPLRAYARLSDVYALGDLNEDGRADAAVILATNTGGTGIFYELFVVEMVDNTASVVDSAFLGDRVIIRAMSIEDAVITLDLTQQGRGDAQCCPSEEAQFIYALENRVLMRTGETTASSAEISTAGSTVDAFMQTYLQDPTGLSSLDFVTEELQTEIATLGIAEVMGITESISSYFYGIQQRGALAVRVKATLNQSILQNIFFDLSRVGERWLIAAIEPATPATTALSENPCHLDTTNDNIVYDRPRAQSDLFATLPSDTTVILTAQTVTGWLGFEPGVAQAANTGVFRYRWFAPNGDYTLSASCDNLPLVVAVQATQCYTMPQTDVAVHEGADPASPIIAILPAGTSFAAIVERLDEWVQVDLMDSSLFQSQMGWISADTLNFNGATCADVIASDP